MQTDVLEALVERIYPESPDAPGARSLGIAHAVLDGLDSTFGRGDDSYRDAPFSPDVDASFGWQLRESRADLLGLGLDVLDLWARADHGAAFVELDVIEQDAMIQQIEDGTAPRLRAAEWRAFFDLVIGAVFEALLIRPGRGSYGTDVAWSRLVPAAVERP